jgi:hypothetical protein
MVIVVIAILFGVFVWPTRYRYDHVARGWLIRIDRFTSRVEILRNGGWECYAGCPRNTTYDDLLTPAMPASTPTSPAVSPPSSSLSPVTSRLDLVPISGYTSRLIAVGAASGYRRRVRSGSVGALSSALGHLRPRITSLPAPWRFPQPYIGRHERRRCCEPAAVRPPRMGLGGQSAD